MTIEIHSPELEALIREHINSGKFQNVEEILIQALTSPSQPITNQKKPTSADFIAAMQASPFPELKIEPARYRLPVKEFAL